MRSSAVRRAVAPFLSIALAACGLFGDDPATFDVTADAATASIQQNGSGSVVLTITRKNLDKPVTLAIEGTLPTGITATFSPSSVPAGTATATLLLGASSSFTPGTVNLSIKASVEGQADKVIPIVVTVTLRGSHTLALSSSTLTASQGGGGSVSVLINRVNSNAGNVTLTASAPTGITVAFGQSPTTGAATSAAISVASSVAPGSYSVVITGAQPGLTPDPTTTLTVTVQPAPATSAVSIPFCSASLPAFFAYQNDGFNWQVVTPTGSNFNFNATSKLAIAFVSQSTQQIFVQFATRAELSAVTASRCTTNRSLTGSTSNTTAAQTVLVAMGPQRTGATNNAFTLNNLPAATLDLVGSRGSSANQFNFVPDRILLRRGVSQASGTLSVLDFQGSESFAPVTNTLTMSNMGTGDDLLGVVTFLGSTLTEGLVSMLNPVTSSVTLYSVPAGQVMAGDFYELYFDSINAAGTDLRIGYQFLTSIADRTEAFGPNVSTATLQTVATAPYPRFRVQAAAQTEYSAGISFILFQPPPPNATKRIEMIITSGYTAGAPATWDVTLPDLSGLTGFQNSWMIAPGQNFLLRTQGFSASRNSLLLGADVVAGDFLRIGIKEALLTATSGLRADSRPITPSRDRNQYFRK